MGARNIKNKNKGLCFKHGAIRPRCKINGCENVSAKGGVCVNME